MKAVTKYLAWLFLCLFLQGCEQLEQKTDTVRDFFRQPTVLPVLEVIQISVPTGWCAVVALADHLGHAIPGAEISHSDGFSLIRIKNSLEYPLSLLSVPCEEIYIIRLEVEEDMCIMGSFFVSDEPLSGQQKVYHVGPVPVLLDGQHIRVIFARNHVAVENELLIELKVSQAEIDMAIDRLMAPEPESVSVAVAQDAWVLEIETENTWNDFSDDKYMITGGEQHVSTFSDQYGNAASVLQMAMIGLTIDPVCLKNPVSGFTVLREIGLETGHDGRLDELVLGTVLYTFDMTCAGRVKVPVATGSFLLALGQEIEFDMTD